MSFKEAFNVSVNRSEDPLSSFMVCDVEVGSPSYFGYCGFHGAWFIQKHDEVAGTMRYAAGPSAYATAWANRASLTYALPDSAG